MALDSAGGVWADTPLQVCSVTSFSKISNKALIFQSFLHWPSARKRINTISIVLLGKAFPLEFSCAYRRSYHNLCCSSHTAHSPLLVHAPMGRHGCSLQFHRGISRSAKGNRALHMGQAWYSNQYINAKSKWKWATDACLSESSRFIGTLKLLVQGLDITGLLVQGLLTFTLLWGMKNLGSWMSLSTGEPLIWWQKDMPFKVLEPQSGKG